MTYQLKRRDNQNHTVKSTRTPLLTCQPPRPCQAASTVCLNRLSCPRLTDSTNYQSRKTARQTTRCTRPSLHSAVKGWAPYQVLALEATLQAVGSPANFTSSRSSTRNSTTLTLTSQIKELHPRVVSLLFIIRIRTSSRLHRPLSMLQVLMILLTTYQLTNHS